MFASGGKNVLPGCPHDRAVNLRVMVPFETEMETSPGSFIIPRMGGSR